MVLLALRSRRCLTSSCMGTLCLQLLLWILCAVNGEEQPFSVEVRSGTVYLLTSRDFNIGARVTLSLLSVWNISLFLLSYFTSSLSEAHCSPWSSSVSTTIRLFVRWPAGLSSHPIPLSTFSFFQEKKKDKYSGLKLYTMIISICLTFMCLFMLYSKYGVITSKERRVNLSAEKLP